MFRFLYVDYDSLLKVDMSELRSNLLYSLFHKVKNKCACQLVLLDWTPESFNNVVLEQSDRKE